MIKKFKAMPYLAVLPFIAQITGGGYKGAVAYQLCIAESIAPGSCFGKSIIAHAFIANKKISRRKELVDPGCKLHGIRFRVPVGGIRVLIQRGAVQEVF